MEVSSLNNCRTPTPFLRVHFASTVLPSRVEIFGLLIKVHVNRSKPMFCDKCQHYGHTNKFCKNPARCNKCGLKHSTSESSIIVEQCLNCQIGGHATGSESCPFFESLKKKSMEKVITNRNKTYAEVVQKSTKLLLPSSQPLFITSQTSGEYQSAFPSSSSASKSQAKNSTKKPVIKNPTRRKRRRSASPLETEGPAAKRGESSREDSVPPGFRFRGTSDSACAAFIKKMCRSMKLSSFWINIVNTVVIPLMETIVSQITSFVSPLLATFNFNNA